MPNTSPLFCVIRPARAGLALAAAALDVAILADDGSTIEARDQLSLIAQSHLALRLRRPLESGFTLADAASAIDWIAPAIELRATETSTVAVAVGQGCTPLPSVANLGVIMLLNGRAAEHGSTAAVLGNPIRTLMALARHISVDGAKLAAGTLVLTGAITAPVTVVAGDRIAVRMEAAGSVVLGLEAAA